MGAIIEFLSVVSKLRKISGFRSWEKPMMFGLYTFVGVKTFQDQHFVHFGLYTFVHFRIKQNED